MFHFRSRKWVYFTTRGNRTYGFVANSFSITGPRFDDYASFKADAKKVHNFVCSTRQSLPHCFEPEVMGLMSVMETLAGKKNSENCEKIE